MKLRFFNTNNSLSPRLLSLTLVLSLMQQPAFAGIVIGGGGGDGFDGITAFMQDLINWMAGPFFYVVLCVSVLLVAALWVADPKSPVMQWVCRLAIGGIVGLNFPIFLTHFKI